MGSTAQRRGMTLIELLVALSLMLLLAGIAVHTMDFSADRRRVREGAREVSVFMSSARTQAMATGRPCGVRFRALEGQPRSIVGLDLVEVPPPYAGDTLDATATLAVSSTAGHVVTVGATMDPPVDWDLIHHGDRIQFNYQGPWYEIEDVLDGGATLTLEIHLGHGAMLPWSTTASARVPYQIVRGPRKTGTGGLQLPERTVIDLQFSGTSDHDIDDHMDEDPDKTVCIMFSPNGSLDRIYHPHGGSGEHEHAHVGAEPIYLLVGKQERMPAGAAEDGLANWQDPDSYWIRLSPQTGMVTRAEVAVDTTLLAPSTVWDTATRAASREFAREGESVGGR